ncbi:MAG TPA: response regulator transcription factor [Dehalococcoidia bacterium]|nr:response regulator transcription factor [Dehalococcoidia bacterium]
MDKIRILLAEDHVVVRESIRQLLGREHDLEVVGEASEGEEAVRLTTQLKPDVVVMDIAMPKLNGIEATKRIKTLCPATAVLALTAYDYDQYVFALLEAGAAGYLLKDVSGQELVEAVRPVHRGDSVLHPTVARKVVEQFRKPAIKPGDDATLSLLTEREVEVLKRAARGMSNKDIAGELFLSVRTIEACLGSIFNKLGVGSRTEAVVHGLKKGWFTLEDLEIE